MNNAEIYTLYFTVKNITFSERQGQKFHLIIVYTRTWSPGMTYPLSLQTLRHLFPAQFNSLVLNVFLY